MIAVDTNILVYAHRRDSPWHEAASRCIDRLTARGEMWAIPWPCVHEFIAVVTKLGKTPVPERIDAAMVQVAEWLDSPGITLLQQTDEHWKIFQRQVRQSAACGNVVHDARIAAICLENNVREIWTANGDFSRFPELLSFNPLAEQAHDHSPVYGSIRRARMHGRRLAARQRALANAEIEA